jgi:hypothetical protein
MNKWEAFICATVISLIVVVLGCAVYSSHQTHLKAIQDAYNETQQERFNGAALSKIQSFTIKQTQDSIVINSGDGKVEIKGNSLKLKVEAKPSE